MIIIRFLSSFFVTSFFLVGYWFATLGKTDKQRRLLRGQWTYKYLLTMGPLYVKMGQILATRSDLIDNELSTQLRQLQDDAPPTNEEYVRLLLTQELDLPIESVFATFSWKPVASASIAQVHEAVLTTGQRVAVKIVKKNVREQLTQNLSIARLSVKLIHALLPSVRYLNLPARFKELYALLLAQTDLRQEAEHQETVYTNFKGHPYVRVPMLIPELCTSSIIVMEFMEGIRGKEAHKVNFPPSQLARRLQETIYTMLYMDGLCHGDPHPGNIFFSKTGDIILLDFGITVQLSENEKWGLSSFYYACTRKEWDIAVKRFTQYFVTNKSKVQQEWKQYEQDMKKVLKLHFDERTSRWSTITYFQDVNQVLGKYEAQYTTNFTKVELVFLSCEGFLSQIDPEIDVWANARKFTDRFSPYMNSTVKATFDQYFATTSPSSLELRDRAKHSLVAPTHLDRYFFPSTYPLFVKSAVGSKIEDFDGNSYVDLSCGYGPNILGYAHPAAIQAITEAVQKGGINALGHVPEVLMAETLVQAFPGAEKAIFSNSGTEAVLQAIRLCRAYRKRDRVAKFEGQYHGFSDQGMVSSWFRFTGSKERPEPIDGSLGSHQGIVKSTSVLQYGQALSLERIYEERDRLACVICEPMPSVLATYDQEFLSQLRKLCTDYDIPLVFDEVVSGFRVAYGGVQNLANVYPDLTCLGKIIGGGLPAGSVVGKQKLIDIAKSSQDPFLDYETKTFVGGTMSGNSLTCNAGLAVLNYLHQNPGIYTQLEEKTNWLTQELKEIAHQHNVPFKIKANRSIFAFSFSYKNTKLYREKQAGSNFKANLALAYYMRKHGVYMPELHTLMLNAAHTDEDLQVVTNAFDKSLREMVADNFFIF